MQAGNMLAAVVLGMLVSAGSALAFTRPGTPPEPNSSDDVLVTKVIYDAAGRQKDLIDNKGIVTRREYDGLGRMITQIEHYTDGTPTDSTNRTTTFEYTADSQIRLQTAVLPAGQDDQTTRYVFSAELTDKGSVVKSNSYLRAVIYPDSDDTVSGKGERDGRACHGAEGEAPSREPDAQDLHDPHEPAAGVPKLEVIAKVALWRRTPSMTPVPVVCSTASRASSSQTRASTSRRSWSFRLTSEPPWAL